jgi:hypothetical protein
MMGMPAQGRTRQDGPQAIMPESGQSSLAYALPPPEAALPKFNTVYIVSTRRF